MPPPDDTGSETFRRFRYQAEVAFPFCLDAALIGNVVSVVPEHLEDVAVEFADGSWRLIQIKTRDSDQGAWTLAVLLGTDGGAFRSLLRAYRAVRDLGVSVSLELRLEGGIKKRDAAEDLTDGASLRSATRDTVAAKLGISTNDAAELLERLTVRPDQPSRYAMQAVNERKLGLAAPTAPNATVRGVYEHVLHKIEAAMDARLAVDRWPVAAMDPSSQLPDDTAVLAEKRITREVLEPLFRPLGMMEPTLLHRLTDPETTTSALEDKLWAAGASQRIVDDAKLLRAHASIREAELAASSLIGDLGRLEDVRVRLRVLANACAA